VIFSRKKGKQRNPHPKIEFRNGSEKRERKTH
jgi:hypothetical protein